MAKSKAMGDDPFFRVKLTEQQWKDIAKDYMTGVTKETIMKKYNLNSVRFKQIRNYLLNPQSKEDGQKKAVQNAHNYSLQKLKTKSGAGKQGRNEICLCGSGRKHKSCCGANK